MIVHCSSKLKEFLQPLMSKGVFSPSEDKWNAHLFLINRKKCIAFIHKETIYSVVLFDVRKADVPNQKRMFEDAFIRQLYRDQILEEGQISMMREYASTIHFLPTDNDKSAIGSLNDVIFRVGYKVFDGQLHLDRAIRYASHFMNKCPIKNIGFCYPKTKMQEKILQMAEEVSGRSFAGD